MLIAYVLSSFLAFLLLLADRRPDKLLLVDVPVVVDVQQVEQTLCAPFSVQLKW